jgi:hypothetical protein
MNEITQQIAEERFELLPPIIQETIKNSGWQEKLNLICRKNNIFLDQVAEIESIILMVMVGVFHPNELKDELVDIVGNENVVNSLLREIEVQIFQEIKKDIIENFENFEAEETKQEENNQKIAEENDFDTEEERENLLKEIEDPETYNSIPPPAPKKDDNILNFIKENVSEKPKAPTKEVLPQQSSSNKLFEKSVSEEKVEVVSNSNQSSDPYREPIE